MSTPSDAASERLHPLTLLLRVLRSIPALAIALFSATAGIPDSASRVGLIVTLGFSVLYGAVALPLIIAHYSRFRYRITDREIIIRSGVFRRRKRNIPLERVQNVAIERSLLPRLMGLASVKLMTAGSNEAEGVLEYTSHDKALDIRDFVRRRSELDLPPEEAAEEAPKSETLIDMSLGRVCLAGMLRFSFVYIAIILSVLTYAQQLMGFTEQDAYDWVVGGGAEELAAAAQNFIWILGALALLGACLMAWVSGLLVTVVRFFNFKLLRLQDKLERSHGLFTLVEATIPLKRIQALVVRSNPLMRALGWFRLELQTIGHDASKRGDRIAILLATLEELATAAPRIRPFTLPESFERVSPLHIRRSFVRYCILLTVLIVPAALWLGWSFLYWGFLLTPLLAYMAYLQYRNHGYAHHEGNLFVRRGVLQQYLWIIPTERFQNFQVSGTLFQRRLGLRTVSVDTAGAGYVRFPHIVDVSATTAETIAAEYYDALRRHSAAASDGSPAPTQTRHAPPATPPPATEGHLP